MKHEAYVCLGRVMLNTGSLPEVPSTHSALFSLYPTLTHLGCGVIWGRRKKVCVEAGGGGPEKGLKFEDCL